MRKALAVPILCLLLLSLVACGPSDYEKVAKGLVITSQAVSALQNVVIEGQKTGTISQDDARAIMVACVKIGQAGIEATKLTRTLVKLGKSDRVTVFQLIHPVLVTVDNAVALDLAGINDQTLRKRIRLALGSIQLTLRAIEVALVGGDNVPI
jgi:hypothetical protein